MLAHTDVDQFRLPQHSVLSPRLGQVLERMLAGESAKEVAFRLGISVHTVREYMQEIYRRFGVSGRNELMARIMQSQGLLIA